VSGRHGNRLTCHAPRMPDVGQVAASCRADVPGAQVRRCTQRTAGDGDGGDGARSAAPWGGTGTARVRHGHGTRAARAARAPGARNGGRKAGHRGYCSPDALDVLDALDAPCRPWPPLDVLCRRCHPSSGGGRAPHRRTHRDSRRGLHREITGNPPGKRTGIGAHRPSARRPGAGRGVTPRTQPWTTAHDRHHHQQRSSRANE